MHRFWRAEEADPHRYPHRSPVPRGCGGASTEERWYIEILQEEIAADPADDSRLDFLAAEYHQLEMYAEAAEVAERIAGVRPNDARAHLFVGVYHLLYRPDLPKARADSSGRWRFSRDIRRRSRF